MPVPTVILAVYDWWLAVAICQCFSHVSALNSGKYTPRDILATNNDKHESFRRGQQSSRGWSSWCCSFRLCVSSDPENTDSSGKPADSTSFSLPSYPLDQKLISETDWYSWEDSDVLVLNEPSSDLEFIRARRNETRKVVMFDSYCQDSEFEARFLEHIGNEIGDRLPFLIIRLHLFHHSRHLQELFIETGSLCRGQEDVAAVASAIRGHPSLRKIAILCNESPSIGPLLNAMGTCPVLNEVVIPPGADGRLLQSSDSFLEMCHLRASMLVTLSLHWLSQSLSLSVSLSISPW